MKLILIILDYSPPLRLSLPLTVAATYLHIHLVDPKALGVYDN